MQDFVKIKIVSVFLILCCGSLVSAQSSPIGISITQVSSYVFAPFSDPFPQIRQQISPIIKAKPFPELSAALHQPQPQSQPGVYNYHHLAFFCKIEVQLEKASKFPVKFRLGDVNYVDRLEGKGF